MRSRFLIMRSGQSTIRSGQSIQGNILVLTLIIIAIMGAAAAVSMNSLGLQQQTLNYSWHHQQLFWINHQQIKQYANSIQQQLPTQILQLSNDQTMRLDPLIETDNVSFDIQITALNQQRYILQSTAVNALLQISNHQYQTLTISTSTTNTHTVVLREWGQE